MACSFGAGSFGAGTHSVPSPLTGEESIMSDPIKPTTETDRPNRSTEHQRDGDARRPSDTLDKGQESTEGEEAPVRDSSLL